MQLITLMQFVLMLMIFAGLYQVGLILLRLPSRRAERSFRTAVVQRKSLWDSFFNAAVKPLIDPVAPLLPISYEHEVNLEAELRQVGITSSAREYYAKAIIIAIYTVPSVLLVPVLDVPHVFYLATLLIPFWAFLHFSSMHTDLIKEKRLQIRRQLPSFVRIILYSLQEAEGGEDEKYGQVNLVRILSNYLVICPEVFYYDVSLLVTEMQSISMEAGLRRFGERLRIPQVMYLCDILIGLVRGQPQAEALALLAHDIDVQGREAQKEELLKRPERMKRVLMPLLILGIIAIFYVMGSDLVGSIGFFG